MITDPQQAQEILNRNRKIVRVLTGVLAVFALAMVVMFVGWRLHLKGFVKASPTPSTSEADMTGWQTYQDTKNRFEFQYPASLHPTLHVEVSQGPLISSVFEERQPESYTTKIGVHTFITGVTDGCGNAEEMYVDSQKTVVRILISESLCDEVHGTVLPVQATPVILRGILDTFRFIEPVVRKITPTSFPTPDPSVSTTSWKTYHDTTYSFEFKYPPNLSLKHENGGDSGSEMSSLGMTSVYVPCIEFCPGFSVSLLPGNNGILEDFTASQWGPVFQKTTIDGYPATSIEHNEDGPYTRTRNLYILKGNMIYGLWLGPSDDPTYITILSTFKFSN